MLRNIKVKDAARLMGKSEMFVRIGLQRGSLKFGTAEKISSKYTYHISPKLFYEYLGIDVNEFVKQVEEEVCTNHKVENKIE